MTDDERERLHKVEISVSELRERAMRSEMLLEQNTATTKRVEQNTQEIVELMKGASVLGRLSRWVAAVVGAYLAGKGLKWW